MPSGILRVGAARSPSYHHLPPPRLMHASGLSDIPNKGKLKPWTRRFKRRQNNWIISRFDPADGVEDVRCAGWPVTHLPSPTPPGSTNAPWLPGISSKGKLKSWIRQFKRRRNNWIILRFDLLNEVEEAYFAGWAVTHLPPSFPARINPCALTTWHTQ